MVKTPKAVASVLSQLADAPEGRTYIVIGYGVWGRSPIVAKAWANTRHAGKADDMRRFLVYEVAEGSYLSGDGLTIAHDTASPASKLVLRYPGEAKS